MRSHILLTLGLMMVVTALPFRSIAATPPMEYVDNQYEFAFQFLADWKIEKNLPPGEAGETRAIIRHPTKPMHLVATVGEMGTSITKREFQASANPEAAIKALITWTVEQVQGIDLSRDTVLSQ